jgi:hypothetical protein
MMKIGIIQRKLFLLTFVFSSSGIGYAQMDFKKEVIKVLKPQIVKEADWALKQEPLTITSFISERSAGGKHDFYSEGDYWWPDPDQPDGPYLQRDGHTNPDNFVQHRSVMIRLSRIIGALASAYVITNDNKYVLHAFDHLRSWFVDTTTRMNPSLLYAQAIKGRVTGRGIGIIDTIHLMEVAQGTLVMEDSPGTDKKLLASVKNWFAEYLHWLTTHPYGNDEMNATNNHGTCWVMQVASFAKLTGDEKLIRFCKDRYKSALLPDQMAKDGSFERELKRTKPYGYSLFNLDAMTMVCHILSDKNDNLWYHKTSDGRSIKRGVEFLYPYVKSKDQWPFAKDVMYWDNWPVAPPFLIFSAMVYNNKEWFDTWKGLDHAPEIEEVIRNLPVRNPILWIN